MVKQEFSSFFEGRSITWPHLVQLNMWPSDWLYLQVWLSIWRIVVSC